MRISYWIDTGIWSTVFLSRSDTTVYVCKCPTSNALLSLGVSSFQNCSYLYANSVFSRSKRSILANEFTGLLPLVVVSAATLASSLRADFFLALCQDAGLAVH